MSAHVLLLIPWNTRTSTLVLTLLLLPSFSPSSLRSVRVAHRRKESRRCLNYTMKCCSEWMSYTNLVLHTVTKAGVNHALSVNRRTIEVENEGLNYSQPSLYTSCCIPYFMYSSDNSHSYILLGSGTNFFLTVLGQSRKSWKLNMKSWWRKWMQWC